MDSKEFQKQTTDCKKEALVPRKCSNKKTISSQHLLSLIALPRILKNK